jgi:hypothetical protein
MKLQRLAIALASAGLLTATSLSGPAVAADPAPSPKDRIAKATQQQSTKAAADACISLIGWVTPTGIMRHVDVEATKPPTVFQWNDVKFVGTRAAGTWYLVPSGPGNSYYYYGLFLQGGNLYRHKTMVDPRGAMTPKATKVGSGWSSFKTIATSDHTFTGPRHAYLYGLNTNGSLYRYAQIGTAVKPLGSFAGFKSFKAMTVVSETATYDTLLMTTTSGALYTVRIPIAATTKPVLKLIRSTGFAQYEALTVQSCGARGGSLINAIDHDTNTGYEYAFSKFTGTATAMTTIGKIPAVFNGATTFGFAAYYEPLGAE